MSRRVEKRVVVWQNGNLYVMARAASLLKVRDIMPDFAIPEAAEAVIHLTPCRRCNDTGTDPECVNGCYQPCQVCNPKGLSPAQRRERGLL